MAAVTDVVIEGLTEAEGWESVWLQRKDEPADPTEAEKRRRLVYEMLDEPGRFLVTVIFPAVVPNHPLKFRYGMPEVMPDYKIRVELSDNVLYVRAAMEDPVVSKLCDHVADFPAAFTLRFDCTEPVKSFDERYWNKMLVVQLPKSPT